MLIIHRDNLLENDNNIFVINDKILKLLKTFTINFENIFDIYYKIV